MQKVSLPLRQLGGIIRLIQHAQGAPQALANVATERQLSSQAASTSRHGFATNWRYVTFPLLGAAAAGAAWTLAGALEMEEDFHLLPLSVRQRIFFKYEKRIRDQSSLDKVFEYFSSQEKDGQKYLTPVDMLCAVVPTYPPSESTLDRLGYLDGERRSGKGRSTLSRGKVNFLQQFDVDGDGLISFPEFLLLLTLMSIPSYDVKTIFNVVDRDGSGYVDREEFGVVMDLLQARANVHTAVLGRSKKLSLDAHTGLFARFFGRDGSRRLFLPEFTDFLQRLHDELAELEFAHYDVGRRGSIPARDLGRSLAAAAHITHVDRLLDKVDAMDPELAQWRISPEEFRSVYDMRRNVHTLQVALDFFRQMGRPLVREEFSRLLAKLAGVSLSPAVLDVVFTVFGDEVGRLDVTAFLEALQRREVMWARHRSGDVERAASTALTRALEAARRWLLGANSPEPGVRLPSSSSSS